ncbi:MAG: PDZ domain-containing protein [Gemmatimonadota bacterium]|nr:PDZ domain-containing protein [Gemmatimonadota bacterium]
MGQTLFVSSKGDDRNSGTEEQPLATLKRAQEVVRACKQNGPITVCLRQGTYYLNETLIFGAEDSGTKDAPIVYRAYEDEEVVVSGAESVDLIWEDAGDGLVKAKVPEGLDFDQLFINGEKMVRCRYPNADPRDGFFDSSIRWVSPETSQDAIDSARLKGYANPVGAFVHGMMSMGWGTLHFRILEKDPDGVYTFEYEKDRKVEGGWQNSGRRTNPYDVLAEGRMFIENVFEELDAPKEWFLDRETHTLYFKPEEGQTLDDATVEVVVLRHLFEFRGSADNPVCYITLDGLTLTHTSYTFMETDVIPSGGDWKVYRGGAVVFEGAELCTVQNCSFERIGGNGVFIQNYSRDVTVSGCRFVKTGASAVLLEGNNSAVRSRWAHWWGWPEGMRGETPMVNGRPFENESMAKLPSEMLDEGHELVDLEAGPQNNNYPARCVIHDNLMTQLGSVEKQIAGVFISKAKEITVSHNSIYDVPRAAINVNDGCWGGHVIEWNDIFDTSMATREHGAYNSWGRDRYWMKLKGEATPEEFARMRTMAKLDCVDPIVLRHNRIQCAHGYDIDLDDGSGHYHIYGNLCLQGGIKLREGFFRTVENNISTLFSPHVWYPNSGDVVRRNILVRREAYSPRGMGMAGCQGEDNFVDENLFAVYEPPEEHRALGLDVHSKTCDPGFYNPSSGDYRAEFGSEVGFENFPMDQFGVQDSRFKSDVRIWSGLGQAFDKNAEFWGTYVNADLYDWMGATLRSLVNYGRESAVIGAVELEHNDGVLVIDVPAESEAAQVGLLGDTVILSVDNEKVRNIEDLQHMLSIGGVTIQFLGDEGMRELSFMPNNIPELKKD